MTTTDAALLVVGGLLAGAANTLAGGGSSVTLPLLLGFGLSAPVANGTNHVAHFVGATARLAVFARSGLWSWQRGVRVAVPAMLGALAGTYLATVIPATGLRPIIIAALVVGAVLLVANPKRLLLADADRPLRVGAVQIALLFLVGGWAGFVIIGAGTYFLLVLVLSVGFALTEALAVNSLISVLCMALSAVLFLADGEVEGPVALWLAVGTVAGSAVTARLATYRQAKIWLFGLVVLLAWGEVIYLIAQLVSDWMSGSVGMSWQGA